MDAIGAPNGLLLGPMGGPQGALIDRPGRVLCPTEKLPLFIFSKIINKFRYRFGVVQELTFEVPSFSK